jgi:hypothetical protein
MADIVPSLTLLGSLSTRFGRSGSCCGIRCGLADLPERVAIGVIEWLREPGNDQDRGLLVGPRSVAMDRNRDRVAHGP